MKSFRPYYIVWQCGFHDSRLCRWGFRATGRPIEKYPSALPRPINIRVFSRTRFRTTASLSCAQNHHSCTLLNPCDTKTVRKYVCENTLLNGRLRPTIVLTSCWPLKLTDVTNKLKAGATKKAKEKQERKKLSIYQLAVRPPQKSSRLVLI